MAKKQNDETELPPPPGMDEDDGMDMGIFIPDIPMPDEETEERDIVEDECDAAFKFAFIGTGQGGARLAESFYKLGYRRVCCVNTTNKDLLNIAIPEENKLVMDIGEDGAGKDPSEARLRHRSIMRTSMISCAGVSAKSLTEF